MSILYKVTLETLKKNRTRTLVTIIGILLSAAMFTAVIACVASLQSYMVRSVECTEGTWCGRLENVGDEEIQKALAAEKGVRETRSIKDLGYAAVTSVNESKPYLKLYSTGEEPQELEELLGLRLTAGRMPENDREIALPKHLATNGEVRYALGDTVTLALGQRTLADGTVLDQSTQYQEGELLTGLSSHSYTVVGFFERPAFEDIMAPGYSAFTGPTDASAPADIYFVCKPAGNAYSLLEKERYTAVSGGVHSALLRYSGDTGHSNLNRVLYGMAGILMLLILFGSVSLIYNAFSISVSERTKQFGLLKSIGATRRQIYKSVLFEALTLSVVGIPLGIAAGLGGIAVTLHFTRSLFVLVDATESNVPMILSCPPAALLAAAALALLTVLISAWVPAGRAVRVSPIDSIRQTGDIRLPAKKLRTSPLIYRLFGFEGMLAQKNFRRSRRRYRATVLSLFLSVVLFISASSFCAYLQRGLDTTVSVQEYDISYTLYDDSTENDSADETAALFAGVEGVLETGRNTSFGSQGTFTSALIDPAFAAEQSAFAYPSSDDTLLVNVTLNFVQDDIYRAYLASHGLSESIYMNPDEPVAVALDFAKIWNYDSKRGSSYHILAEKSGSFSIECFRSAVDGYLFDQTIYDDEAQEITGYQYTDMDGRTLLLSRKEAFASYSVEYGTVEEDSPWCATLYDFAGVTLLYPESAKEMVLGDTGKEIISEICLRTDRSAGVFDRVTAALEEKGLATQPLYNYMASAQTNRALILLVNVFSYGFIVLISLISLANVFNTISTNIQLRRREFAMLRSVGMTRRGFDRMMNYECGLYGLKGLIYGIPVAVAVTWLIYRTMLNGIETNFFIPWYSLVIAIGSVFAVVFATMLYAMRKIKKDNLIDALKSENL